MIILNGAKNSIDVTINTGGSKSISNRLLILNHVFETKRNLRNLSHSEDTILLQRALNMIKDNTTAVIDVHHAGTDFRFLTALLAVTTGEWTLTGSDRIKERPVGELVSALKHFGASISYIDQEGFPPLRISGAKLSGGKMQIEAGISSQFISALLLVSGKFKNGLDLSLLGDVVSKPYISMTIKILNELGLETIQFENKIVVAPGQNPAKTNQDWVVESDWSSASYWYSICALFPGSRVELQNLRKESLQADAVLPFIYASFGVTTVFEETSVVLKSEKPAGSSFNYDFTDCPDIAQTVAVTGFGLGIKTTLTGLKTLRIKETNRIEALKNEFEKLGAVVTATADHITIEAVSNPKKRISNPVPEINTYQDHRMAMSFAPLSLIYDQIIIHDHTVVEKSYPHFWDDLQSAGFNVNLQP